MFFWGVTTMVCAQGLLTSDKIVVYFLEFSDPLELNGTSKDCFFTVSLVGKEISYTGYQFDIKLPAGMSVTSTDGDLDVLMANYDNGIYPYTTDRRGNKTFTHSISKAMVDGNVLRVVCTSSESKDLTGEGELFDVYIKASPYMKPGDVEIKIDNVILTHNEWSEVDGMNHAISYEPSEPCGGVIEGVSGECNDVPFNVSSTNHWSTCILPFDVETPSGVTAYTCMQKDGDKVYLTPAESMEAYTPYVLYSENGFSGTLSGNVDASKYPESGFVCTDGLLYGAIVPQEISQGYVLQNLDGVVKFYKCDEQYTYNVPAGKCWLSPDAGSAKSLAFEIADPAGIEEVDTEISDASIYTLDGKKVVTPQPKSIYIKSGKKFISK